MWYIPPYCKKTDKLLSQKQILAADHMLCYDSWKMAPKICMIFDNIVEDNKAVEGFLEIHEGDWIIGMRGNYVF